MIYSYRAEMIYSAGLKKTKPNIMLKYNLLLTIPVASGHVKRKMRCHLEQVHTLLLNCNTVGSWRLIYVM